ncbi:hypothetical protein F4819DRAFT_307001 [Hypoxylon fuscum]|nr:hypothetical protein F4819DRAFT_307001 [Hypoxylon fuscum]
MFEDFAFSQKANSDALPDDDDPPPSPRSTSHHSSPEMATSESPKSDGERIESLVRKMSKQTFIRNTQTASLSKTPEIESEISLPTDQMPIQLQIEPTLLVDEPSLVHVPLIKFGPDQPLEHVIENPPAELPQRHSESIETPPNSLIFNDNSHLRVPKTKRSWQQTEPMIRSTPPSSTLDLMSNMIESGEQCNVHVSAPLTPMTAPLSRSTTSFLPSIQPDDNANPQFADGDKMELEVDSTYRGQDEEEEEAGPSETTPSETLALRDAGAPAGIRKFGLLRYRSSLEAASRCKNMRKSIPRMRRRPKTERSESRASTNTESTSSTVI